MRRILVAFTLAIGVVTGIEAAPTDTVTQADLKVLLDRLSKLEAENKAQAARIAELENQDKQMRKWVDSQNLKVAEQDKKWELQNDRLSQMAKASFAPAEGGTTTNETGRIYTTAQGFKYYLADVNARIFEPLSESGLKITPYGYLVLEGVYSTHGGVCETYTDWLYHPKSRGYDEQMSVLSMQDSILGIQFETPEARAGWKFIGRAEFDLAGGDNANSYDFHWRHLYFDAQHESGWSFLFGQTWHLWKMVTPSEIDGAWMENTGHPYRRSPQIRVTKHWDWEDSSLDVRAGIVKGGPGMGGDRDGDGVHDNTASAWPLFEAAAVYDRNAPWQEEGADNRRWLVGIGGMYGQNRIRNEYDDRKDDYNSDMIMLAGMIPFWDFKLTGQIFAGQNLGGVQAGVGQTVAFDPVMGDGKEVSTVGGFIDLSYQLTRDWSLAVGYGFDSPFIDSGYIEGDADGYSASIEHNDRAYIDAFYQVTTNFKVGIEYARLNTRYAGNSVYQGGTSSADRFQFSAYYDF
ncbi:MAG: hypothetical protein KBT68_03655 [bacterium]|nr:hypothetical protein [Candidatus Colisoma equi]